MSVKSLKQRLADGEDVLCAEGYLFEVQRRGYLKAGSFVPTVVLDHPEVVRQMHEEFVHSGSDIVQAFTYYGHREKMKLADREADVESLNMKALEIANDVAKRTGTLVAGNICNTTSYSATEEGKERARSIFKEEMEWAMKGGVDLMIAETYSEVGEALLALEAIKKYGNGVPAVINLDPNRTGKTLDGVDIVEALKMLEDAGADVVGLNCSFGPKMIIPEMRRIREAIKIPIACLPVPYRTTPEEPKMQNLTLPNGKRAFFDDLDHFYCCESEMREFGKECKEIGINFVGLCCGNSSRHFRALSEAMGRTPPASKYATDMNLHFVLGNSDKLANYKEKSKFRTVWEQDKGQSVQQG